MYLLGDWQSVKSVRKNWGTGKESDGAGGQTSLVLFVAESSFSFTRHVPSSWLSLPCPPLLCALLGLAWIWGRKPLSSVRSSTDAAASPPQTRRKPHCDLFDGTHESARVARPFPPSGFLYTKAHVRLLSAAFCSVRAHRTRTRATLSRTIAAGPLRCSQRISSGCSSAQSLCAATEWNCSSAPPVFGIIGRVSEGSRGLPRTTL